jgi:hypothetical protein
MATIITKNDFMTGDESDPYAFVAGYQYNSIDEGGRPVNYVIKLEQSAIDRYPPGAIGIAGVMVGLDTNSEKQKGLISGSSTANPEPGAEPDGQIPRLTVVR